MLYDSYMDSERYAFVHPRAAAILFKPDVCIRTITHSGFLVATNIKIRQDVRYESTECHRLLTL